MAEATCICLFPDHSVPESSGESSPEWGQPVILARPSVVLRRDVSPRLLSMRDSTQEESSIPGEGLNSSTPPRTVEIAGLGGTSS